MPNAFRKLSRHRALVGGLAGAAVLTAGGAVAYADMTTTVTLSVDGDTRQVSTSDDTVAEVLDAEGIEIGDRDVVAPAPSSELDEGDTVAVRYAKPVELAVDGEESTHWVLANDVSSALGEIGERFSDASLSVSRSAPIGREGVSLEVVTPKTVGVKVGNDPLQKGDLAVMTVGGALTELGVDPDLDDLVELKRGDRPRRTAGYATEIRDGDRVIFSKRTTKRVSRRVTVQPTTERRADSSMLEGRSKVLDEGRAGVRRVVTDVTREDRELVGRERVRTRELRSASPRVVAYGTKQRPAPEPAPAPAPAAPSPSSGSGSGSSSSSSSSGSSAPSGGSNFASGSSVWDSIAACESGGNWAINTGNGYYGGLQFNLATWQGYGGSGYPHQASRSQQIAIAENVRAARGGYGSWPACSQKLGLPQ